MFWRAFFDNDASSHENDTVSDISSEFDFMCNDDHGHALQISNAVTQQLSHKLRAEEDAILVGRTTFDREHPQLTVRHWSGTDPKRIVLTHDRPLPLLIDDLYQQGIQSLIVEGGAMTHQSFLDAGLWDELRVETAPMTVSGGTPAVKLPPNIRLRETKNYQGNTLSFYYK